MTIQEIHDAIVADAEAKALADAGDDAGCAARLGAILPPGRARFVTVQQLMYWGAQSIRGKIDAHAKDTASPIQSLALTYLDMAVNPASPGIDTWDPQLVGATADGSVYTPGGPPVVTPGMLDAYTQAGVFAPSGPGSKDDLINQAAIVPVVITTDQVSAAWAQYRPDGKVVAS